MASPGVAMDATAATLGAGDETSQELAQTVAPPRPTHHTAKTPQAKARLRLLEAVEAHPPHRLELRTAIVQCERNGGATEAELDGARRLLEAEDRKHDVYDKLRRTIDAHLMSHDEDFDDLRAVIQEGKEVGLTADELGPACAMLSEEDFLLSKLKSFNTKLEVKHKTPTARDRSPVASNARDKLGASQSAPELRSEEQPPTSPSKPQALESFECTAEEADAKLGFTPAAWPPAAMKVFKVDPNTWAARSGVKPGDMIVAINGVDVTTMSKQDAVQSLKARPVTISLGRPVDESDAILEKIKEHIKKVHGAKSLGPKKRMRGMSWNGRVEGMSLEEYRELKWSVDACYTKVERRGPSFTMRPTLPSLFDKKPDKQALPLEPLKSYEATLRSVPKWSCGNLFLPVTLNTQHTPGPEYDIKSTMDPSRHPTCPKSTGPRFGSEVLEPRDPPGPAPGDYNPDAIVHSSTIKSTPNFSIQGREAWRAPTAPPGPGVGEYVYEQACRTGKLTPLQFKIQGKAEPDMREAGIFPGPPHYYRCQACQEKPGKDGKKKPPPPVTSWHPAHVKFNPTLNQAAIWKFGGEPRGLRN